MANVTNTSELLALLRRHYIKPGLDLPGGVFVPEVGGNGSWGASARADAIYVGFTSSSGRILVGHELKISRADWLNELNKPGKADQWADQCHAWYLVVNDPAIVKPGELPAGWGLMSPGTSRTRMAVHTPAAVKPDHTPSWDAVRSVMARIDTLRASDVADAVESRDRARHNQYEKDIAAAVERRVKSMPETGRPRNGSSSSRTPSVPKSIGATTSGCRTARSTRSCWHVSARPRWPLAASNRLSVSSVGVTTARRKYDDSSTNTTPSSPSSWPPPRPCARGAQQPQAGLPSTTTALATRHAETQGTA